MFFVKFTKACVLPHLRIYTKYRSLTHEKIYMKHLSGSGAFFDVIYQKRLTGYNRCYASYILRNWGRKIFLRAKNGERFVIIGEFVKRKRYRKRPRKYDEAVLKVLIIFWRVLNFPCGKRLKAELSEKKKRDGLLKY